jgi:hypothetical protein
MEYTQDRLIRQAREAILATNFGQATPRLNTVAPKPNIPAGFSPTFKAARGRSNATTAKLRWRVGQRRCALVPGFVGRRRRQLGGFRIFLSMRPIMWRVYLLMWLGWVTCMGAMIWVPTSAVIIDYFVGQYRQTGARGTLSARRFVGQALLQHL